MKQEPINRKDAILLFLVIWHMIKSFFLLPKKFEDKYDANGGGDHWIALSVLSGFVIYGPLAVIGIGIFGIVITNAIKLMFQLFTMWAL